MSIDVMKQALSAIEFADMYIKELVTGSTNRIVVEDLLRQSREALRAAIEQANEFNPDWDAMAVMVEEQQRMAKRIEELEAQQKPWVKTYAGGQPNYTTPEEPGVKLDASAPLVVQPHPAFKKWQGLTDEEIDKLRHLYDGTAGWTIVRFARAIEAKLKEKNK